MNDSKKISLPSVQIPTLECDVLVAGAGTAGCIAAIAAARQGVSVILVEKTPVPGGTYTNGVPISTGIRTRSAVISGV